MSGAFFVIRASRAVGERPLPLVAMIIQMQLQLVFARQTRITTDVHRAILLQYACDLTRSVRAGPGFSRGETGGRPFVNAHNRE